MVGIQTFIEAKRLPSPVAYAILFLIYISTFRIFSTLPFEDLHQSISTYSIIILSFFYVLRLLITLGRSHISRLDLVMLLFISVYLFSAYQSHVVFGQPYYYGIIAQRSVLLSLSGILLISLLRNDFITIKQVERSFLLVSLSLLFLCYYFFLFVDASAFSNEEFVAYSPIRGYRYRFQFAPVIMLLFYSLFKISGEKKKKYMIIVGLILFYLIYFLQSRTTIVVTFFTLLVYFLRNFSIRQRIRKTLIYGCIIIGIVVFMFNLGYTSLFSKYQLLFQNVSDAIVKSSPGDPSSAMRFSEFKTAIGYIENNLLLGNGFISNQWHGGWQGVLGYFYPVDIGILGNIFVFGIVGTILIYIPYFFSLRMTRKIQSDNAFYRSCVYMLLFFFLSMFVSAVNMRDSSSIMFIVCLIYYFRYHDSLPERNPVSPLTTTLA